MFALQMFRNLINWIIGLNFRKDKKRRKNNLAKNFFGEVLPYFKTIFSLKGNFRNRKTNFTSKLK